MPVKTPVKTPVIIISNASGETLDFKPYEADMRHLIETYIEAAAPRKISPFDNLGLLDLIVKTGIAEAIANKLGGLKGNKSAVAETIENNVRKKIIKQQQRKLREQERETPREFIGHESHFVWGKRYSMSLAVADAPPTRPCQAGKGRLIPTGPRLPCAAPAPAAGRRTMGVSLRERLLSPRYALRSAAPP